LKRAHLKVGDNEVADWGRGEIVVCRIEEFKYRYKEYGVVVEFEDSEKA